MSESLHRETSVEGDGELESPEAFEWARIRTFLRASDAPLALIEIASERDAEEVVAEIRRIAGEDEVHAFSPRPDRDFRWPLDWLEGHGERPGIFLFGSLESYATDQESAERFWTWANMQRERWLRDWQKVVFLLTPAQVDALCRHAPMLWDWIPLKFNLTGEDPDAHQSALAAAMRVAAQPSGERDARDEDAEARGKERLRVHLDGLRQQLLRARQKGLPEHVVIRDYAWPFFQALIAAGEREEARRVVDSELGYEFPAGLPPFQANKSLRMLDGLLRQTFAPERMAKIDRAVRYYLEPASSKSLGELGASIYHFLRGTLAFFSEDFVAAKKWWSEAFARCEHLGFEEGAALILQIQGRVFEEEGRYDSALDCYSKSCARWQRLGKNDENARMLRRQARTLLKRSRIEQEGRAPQPPSASQASGRWLAQGGRFAIRMAHRVAERIDPGQPQRQKRWVKSTGSG